MNNAKKAEAPQLAPEPAKLVKGQQRHRAQTKPVALRQLCGKIGVPAVAKRLGYGESTIYTALNNDNVVKVVEVAAELMMQNHDGRTKTDTNLYMVKVPDESREYVERMLKAFDCKFRHFID